MPNQSRSNVVSEKVKKFERTVGDIERMTTEQKGFLLLDNVRNLAFGSGMSEEYIIALFCEFGGFMEASAICTERLLSERKNDA